MTDLAGTPAMRLLAPSESTRALINFSATLGDQDVRVRLLWSTRAEAWLADVYADDGVGTEATPIIRGRRCAAGEDIFGDLVSENRPAGRLYVVDRSGEQADPARFGWLGSIWLAWVED